MNRLPPCHRGRRLEGRTTYVLSVLLCLLGALVFPCFVFSSAAYRVEQGGRRGGGPLISQQLVSEPTVVKIKEGRRAS